MAINFPNAPTNGSTYTYQGIRYVYKDTGSGTGYWSHNNLGTATAATTEEVNTGTNADKFITPDALSGSDYDKTYSDSYTTNSSSVVATSKAVRDAFINSKMPVGTIVAYAGTSIPSGWLECNGQTVSTSYTEYRSIVGSTTPDLRDLFIRGKSSSRTVGSYQADASQRIQGSILGISESFNFGGTATGAFTKSGTTNTFGTPSNVDTSATGNVYFDSANFTRTANETRPANRAFYYIIKVN